MHRTIFLAVAMAATLFSLPADARRPREAPATAQAALQPDNNGKLVSPPDGAAEASGPRRVRAGAASHRRKASRAAYRSGSVETAHPAPSHAEYGSGVVRSGKTGAKARVSPKWAPKFQAYIDDLEAQGAAIYYMGGLRIGRCSAASQHPCGSALDVCQDSRGRVSGAKDCHLPDPARMAAAAARHGLTEGGTWCGSPDYGHVQAIKSGSTCAARGWIGNGKRQYLASMTGEVRTVSARRHKHKRIRYARAR